LFDEPRLEKSTRDKSKLTDVLFKLQQEHGQNILKSGSELAAEMKVRNEDIRNDDE